MARPRVQPAPELPRDLRSEYVFRTTHPELLPEIRAKAERLAAECGDPPSRGDELQAWHLAYKQARAQWRKDHGLPPERERPDPRLEAS